LIAFEGTEGSGKSTQLRLAATALRKAGHKVRVTFEPGATSVGAKIRKILLHKGAGHPVPLAELFLYLADRAQHVSSLIQPALDSGETVLTDRFSASTLAYQGYGRELNLDDVVRSDAWARGGLWPDLTILLDCPVRIGLSRASKHDRFHAEIEAFHERVRRGFLSLAREDPTSWRVIDSTQSKQEVHRQVLSAIAIALQLRIGRLPD
jgi:dTMP kinase